jgi:DNA-directed RNA polymerase subunit RPC12/RpoP
MTEFVRKKKFLKDASKIVKRLRQTDVTMRALVQEYKCSWEVLKRSVLKHMPDAEYQQIRLARLRRGGFKKGHLPHNYKPVGTILICRHIQRGNAYRRIKIRDSYPARCGDWIPYAKYLWEKKYGPVPEGLFIVHNDGDTLNDSIDNYKMVDRAGNLALQMQRDPEMRNRCNEKLSLCSKKRWAVWRRLTEEQRGKHEERKAVERFKKENKQRFIHGWDCADCGESFEKEPPWKCPKCQGLRFVKVKRLKMTG